MQLRKALFWERFLQALVESSNIQALGAGCENSQAALKGKKINIEDTNVNILIMCCVWFVVNGIKPNLLYFFLYLLHTLYKSHKVPKDTCNCVIMSTVSHSCATKHIEYIMVELFFFFFSKDKLYLWHKQNKTRGKSWFVTQAFHISVYFLWTFC